MATVLAIGLNSFETKAQIGSVTMGPDGTAWGTGSFRSNGERIYFTATSERVAEITYIRWTGIKRLDDDGRATCMCFVP